MSELDEEKKECSKKYVDSEATNMNLIIDKLFEMHSELKKDIELANKLRFKTAFETVIEVSKKESLNALLNHIWDDTVIELQQNMMKKCDRKTQCISMFRVFLQDYSMIIKNNKIDYSLLSEQRKKLEELRCKSLYCDCGQCFFELTRLSTKQIKFIETLSIYTHNQGFGYDISVFKPSIFMSEVLEPISNKQRLEILKILTFGPKNFSAISRSTGLKAGNLHFHLQKLREYDLILQKHERGNYMITRKGFGILKCLNEIYISLFLSPNNLEDC
jgi:DNA-binding HxlR family transcriptional regulator